MSSKYRWDKQSATPRRLGVEMWVPLELSRMLVRIVVAVAIASVIAAVKAVVSGGGVLHTWRISLPALGGLMFLLAGTGRGGAHRRFNLAMDHGPN